MLPLLTRIAALFLLLVFVITCNSSPTAATDAKGLSAAFIASWPSNTLAILKALPEAAIISGFKGTLDFYVWRGLPVCRQWPRRRSVPFTPQEKAQWPVFATASRLWNTLDPSVQDAYNKMASGSTLSGRDMMVKMYINAKTILPY
jgi:hypothetical protein